MAALKTKPTGVEVDAFLETVGDPVRRADARALIEMMGRLSGAPAVMWGPSIIGFGRYQYRYESGHAGEMARIGFAPRGKETVLYLMAGSARDPELMARLGPHRTGKSCVYVKRVDALDRDVLEALIRASLDHMRAAYPEGA